MPPVARLPPAIPSFGISKIKALNFRLSVLQSRLDFSSKYQLMSEHSTRKIVRLEGQGRLF